MLRRIPATPLVCLALLLSTMLISTAWATGPNESLEILLKPNPQDTTLVPAASKVKPRVAAKPVGPALAFPYPPPMGISKVKPQMCFIPTAWTPPCVLPSAGSGQWEATAGVLWATLTGNVMWPRYSPYYYGYYWQDRGADLVDHLMLPKHPVIVTGSLSYHFRPNWAVRYSAMGADLHGNGQPNDYFWFGSTYSYWYSYQGLTSKWQFAYQRAGLVYDAMRTCSSKISVYADWLHTDDKIELNCVQCGNQKVTFSKSGDSMIAGMEMQRCIKTLPNGGTFTCEAKAGGIFLDDAEGVDLEAAARYSIPMGNPGRWGYLKGGYRLVNIKKGQSDYLFNRTLQGGFLEMGFIF